MNRNRNNVVRLTESKLREMIKESVKQVLREGKTVNNKPGFEYNKTLGRNIFTPDVGDYHEKKFGDDFRGFVNFEKGEADKHNRRQNMKHYGHDMLPYGRIDRENLLDMLRYMDVSLEEYKNMSEDEKWELRNDYEWSKSGGGRYGNLGIEPPTESYMDY